MGKYIFKIGQKVFLSKEEHSPFIIDNRKKENGQNLYKLRSILNYEHNPLTKFLWTLWRFYKELIYILVFRNSYLYINIINKTSFWTLIDKFQTVISDSEVFDVGLRNWPRCDNWIYEDMLVFVVKNEPRICSFNGCELVNNFLNNQ